MLLALARGCVACLSPSCAVAALPHKNASAGVRQRGSLPDRSAPDHHDRPQLSLVRRRPHLRRVWIGQLRSLSLHHQQRFSVANAYMHRRVCRVAESSAGAPQADIHRFCLSALLRARAARPAASSACGANQLAPCRNRRGILPYGSRQPRLGVRERRCASTIWASRWYRCKICKMRGI
jgi:hypothetical protein